MRNDSHLIDPFGAGGPRKIEAGDNLIPLINVVFLLLVFFMVAGHIRASDRFEVQPPQQVAELKPDGLPALIQITRDGGLIFRGEVISAVSLDQLLATGAIDLSQPVILKADRQATAQQLNRVLNVIRANEKSSIRIQIRNGAPQ